MAHIDIKLPAEDGHADTPSLTVSDGEKQTSAVAAAFRPAAMEAVAAATPTKGGSGPVLNPRGAD
jgi:hypothetical protein